MADFRKYGFNSLPVSVRGLVAISYISFRFLKSCYSCRYSDRLPFRERSENAEIATELSLQPWRAFQPDGVIMFSDILTPLPVLGIEFDILKGRGPAISTPIRRYDICVTKITGT